MALRSVYRQISLYIADNKNLHNPCSLRNGTGRREPKTAHAELGKSVCVAMQDARLGVRHDSCAKSLELGACNLGVVAQSVRGIVRRD
jgi:hypothetical protein